MAKPKEVVVTRPADPLDNIVVSALILNLDPDQRSGSVRLSFYTLAGVLSSTQTIDILPSEIDAFLDALSKSIGGESGKSEDAKSRRRVLKWLIDTGKLTGVTLS